MAKFVDKIKSTKLFAFIKKLYYDTRIRFLFVGGLNTLIGLVVDTVVCLIFQHYTTVSSSIYLVVGSVSGTVLGAINSYFWNKYFTFRSKKKSLSEAVRFAIVYIVCFFFSYFAQMGSLKLFGYKEESIYFYIAKVCILVVQVFLSWFGQRYFCFKKEKKTPEEHTEGEDSSTEAALHDGSLNEENINNGNADCEKPKE